MMMPRMNVSRYAIGLLAAGLMVVPVASAAAQQPANDSRWSAWTGCWTPVGTPDGATVPLMCVVPAAGVSAVDMVTVSNGVEVAREHIDASGQMVNHTRDGCRGWDRADWSQDNQRVYLHANYTCPGGRRQVSSSLLGMTADGELLNVQGLEAGTNKGIRVTRYDAVTDSVALPPAIAAAVNAPSMIVSAGRVAASAPLRIADVVDASAHADAPVVQAWLANHGDGFSVDAHDLVAMANSGVPGDVTDMLVALSHPESFSLNPSLMGAAQTGSTGSGAYADQVSTGRLRSDGTNAGAYRPDVPMCPYMAYGWDYNTNCYYSGYYGAAAFNPYWMSRGYGYLGYNAYGPGYGYGYGYGYGNGWYGGSPVVVITQPTSGSNANHGRVVKGRGYVSGTSQSGGTSSQSAPAPSHSSGSTGSSTAGKSSSGSSSSGARTAHKTGGGGV